MSGGDRLELAKRRRKLRAARTPLDAAALALGQQTDANRKLGGVRRRRRRAACAGDGRERSNDAEQRALRATCRFGGASEHVERRRRGAERLNAGCTRDERRNDVESGDARCRINEWRVKCSGLRSESLEFLC